jgi:hypothetical protein
LTLGTIHVTAERVAIAVDAAFPVGMAIHAIPARLATIARIPLDIDTLAVAARPAVWTHTGRIAVTGAAIGACANAFATAADLIWTADFAALATVTLVDVGVGTNAACGGFLVRTTFLFLTATCGEFLAGVLAALDDAKLVTLIASSALELAGFAVLLVAELAATWHNAAPLGFGSRAL